MAKTVSMRGCKYCGKLTKNPQFCSAKCHGAYEHLHHKETDLYTQSVGSDVDAILMATSVATGGLLKRGMLTNIAVHCGCSRELVRQRAKKLGLLATHTAAKIINRHPCRYCGKIITEGKNKYCSPDCYEKHRKKKYYVSLPCEWCGKPFEIYKSVLRKGYRRQRFCSRNCWGKYTGTRHGFGSAV